MRKQNWFGILVCIVAVLPGFAVGALVGLVFALFNGGFDANPDFLFTRTLLGFTAPGAIWDWIIGRGLPAFIQGIVAGCVAVAITRKVYLGNQLELAAFSAAALYAGMFLTLALVILFMRGLGGMEWDTLHDVLQIGGLGAGLIGAAYNYPDRVSRVTPT